MADDRLELIASVKNLTSGPIRDIQRSMRALAAETSGAHKLATFQAKGHTEQLYKLRQEVGRVAERVRTGFAPALSAIGIGSLSAAAGVTALTKSLVDFAGNARHLEFMSKQTQLTVNQLRGWEQEASRLGTTTESLTGGFVEFNAAMEKMARMGRMDKTLGIRTEMAELQGILKLLRPQEIEGLVRGLQGLGREAQVEKILKFADKIPDIAKRMELLKAFHLDPNLANKQSAEILKDLDGIGERLGKLTEKQLKAGTDFQESLERIKDSLTGLRDVLGAGLAKDMGDVADALAKFADAHHADIAKGLHEFVKEMRELGESKFVAGLREFASGLNSVVQATTGWAPIVAAMAAYKVAQFTGIIAGLKGVAGAMRLLGAVPPPAWLMPLLTALAAAKGAQEFAKDPGGATGLTGPNSMANHIKELYGMLFGGGSAFKGNQGDKDALISGFKGNQGDKDSPAKDTRPLWRRLFDMRGDAGGSIMPAGFRVPDDWKGALKTRSTGGGDARAAEEIIERGTLAALRDFAAEQKGTEGGGGGGGPGMSAIRAAYSPSGSPAGEPSSDGGADTGSRPSRSPMGSLPDVGAKPKGIESLKRTFHAPSIPSGMGGMVADRLKAAGVNLPPHLDAKIRSGGQVTEGDLKALPPATLEKINKHITGLGQPPLYTDAKPPHFGLGDIRKSLAGTSAAGGLPDTGSYAGVARRGFGGATQLPSGPSAANPYIASQRAGFAKELQDPQFRSQFAAMLQAEGPTLGTAESAMNRAAASGRSLHEMVAGRTGRAFYSTYGSFMRGSASALRKYNPLIDKSLAGSDTIRGFTDQGMPTDPNGPLHRPVPYLGPYVGQHGNIFNDWQRGRYAKWRENFEAHAQAAQPATGSNAAKNMPNIGAALGGTATQEENNWRRLHTMLTTPDEKGRIPPYGHREDALIPGPGSTPFGQNKFDYLKSQEKIMQRGVVPSREQLEPRREQHADLLGHARMAGLVGAPLNHKVTGSATLDVNFNNAPQGTTHRLKADGMFTKIALNRGRAMPPARQDG